MVTKRISLTLAALVGIGVAIGSSAHAQVIVQPFTFPATTVPFTQTFTFNTFNTSLGLLDSVEIQLSTNITAEVDIFNLNAGAEPFTNAKATVPISLTGPDATTLNATATAGPFNGTANPGLNTYTGLTSSASTSAFVPVANFGFYETPPSAATGTLTVSSAPGSYSGSSVSGVFFGGSATASGSVTLTYFYQPSGTIPEPGATTFLAAGVLGSLGMVFRRRRNK